jgi:predicted secreted acid phosphatase
MAPFPRKKMKKTIWLIDIDGTICEDVPNEESWKFLIAKPLPGSLEKVKKFYENGDRVTFFTARTDEHKEATEKWLDMHGFPYESVVYNKPRISEGEAYHWVDNKSVFASYLPEGLR